MGFSSVYTASNEVEAEIVAGFLRREGIPAHVEAVPVHLEGMFPAGVSVWVPVEHAEQAAEVAKTWRRRGSEGTTET